MQDVNNRGNWEARWGYVETLLSAQFFCKSKTALKIKTVVGKKKSMSQNKEDTGTVQNQQTFTVRGQRVNILGFVGHKISITTISTLPQ